MQGRQTERQVGAGESISKSSMEPEQPSAEHGNLQRGDNQTHLPGRFYYCLPQLKTCLLLELWSHSLDAHLTGTSTAPQA